jgi:hypothetical protein
MSFRALRLLALCLAVAACGDGSGLLGVAGSGDAATVRFVNATGSPLDLAVNGVVSTSNANIAPGSGVGCFAVQDPAVPGLSVRPAGSATPIAGLNTLFSSGGRYTLIAYVGPTGQTQFASVPNAAIAVAGRSALRVFDGSAGLGAVDVYVNAPGTVLGAPRISGLGFGASTGSFDVSAGTQQVRLTNNGTTTVVFDSGTLTLAANASYTLVVSSATAAILVPDCT